MTKKEDKKNPFVVFLLSILRVIINAFGILFRIILKLFNFFGLWIPLAYVVFGIILYYTQDFDPLRISTLESQLYVSGFVAATLCSLVISVKNLFRKSANILNGVFKPIISKTAKKVSKSKSHVLQTLEKPKIYYSKLEANTLVHEYKDRFEIYTVKSNGISLDRIEFKEFTR